MENNLSEELRERFVNRFLDVMILGALTRKPMSGYDFVLLTSNEFYVTISPATIYSTLYSMERKGLIEGGDLKRKRCASSRRVYTLTPKGKETLNNIVETKEEILSSLEGAFEQMI
jgi:DNA-binding PadR family transcriptional regulator